ncbi:MAG: glycerol kinase GlpK [Acidimicrobiia bacterium]|nr:glycerol kinase GlpK [Acidimicrobiia bacterium]
MTAYVGAIDQGTTSSRFVIIDRTGLIVAKAQTEHQQILPQPGWVEHDASEIWRNTEWAISTALDEAGLTPVDLAGVGITNQRETSVVWNRGTGRPVANAIVWQDTRTADLCAEIGHQLGEGFLRRRTGLPAATYFSGPKVRWLLDSDDEIRREAQRGGLAFGTIDSWLAFNLTGRHVTDVTNASRTMLMNLETLDWDHELCEAIGIPPSMLPDIEPSITDYGSCSGVLEGTRLRTILGDQHAAMIGQAAFSVGDTKCTYGTGAFLLANTGVLPVASTAGLLTTVAYQRVGQPARYALEGSVAVAGSSVQWLRDNLDLIEHSEDIEALASLVPDNGDVYFVPAFSGLFAPRWRPDARGVIAGMTRFTNKSHLARAVLEATAFQVKDVLNAMRSDLGSELTELRVDGGMVANTLLMQFQADILRMDVVIPRQIETTVVGAAYGAGIDAGVWADEDELRSHWQESHRYTPQLGDERVAELDAGWSKAIERSLDWV